MKKYLVVILVGISIGLLKSQDLIERVQKGLPPIGISKSSTSSKRVDLKSNFEILRPYSINIHKTNDLGLGEIYLDLDKSFLSSFHKKSQKRIDIPVSAHKSIELLVAPVEILNPGAIATDEKGEKLDLINGVFYHGIVSDDPSTTVAVSVFKNDMRILISDPYGNYNIGPTQDKKSYVLYNDFNLGAFPFECANDQLDVGDQIVTKKGKNKNYKSSECVKVYIEADYRSYTNFDNDAQAVLNFIQGTFNEVAVLYDNINIPISLSEVKVWTVDDPYDADNNVSTALGYLSDNVDSFNGDLFHLVSAIGNCCSWGGIGYVGSGSIPGLYNRSTVCGNNPFAVSQTSLYYSSLPNYSWTVNVFAHEMGHNMGSPHTHECAWGEDNNLPLDGCYVPDGCDNPGLPNQGEGTIMSYCHTIPSVGISLSNGFHIDVASHLLEQYNSRACLTPCGPILGCTNTSDHNYNPSATESDDSCTGTCSDGIKNGDEEDIDCGGSKCAPCNIDCDENYIQLTLTFDQYSSETSWNIKDSSGQIIHFGANYTNRADGSIETVDLCLSDGEYTFSIIDSYGDGICCAYGNGSYRIIDVIGDGLAEGGSFERVEESTIIFNNTVETSCTDGIQNGTETDVDCGGLSCNPCDLCDQENLMISSNQILLGNQAEIIKDKISTNAKITVDHAAIIMWQAGQSIEINGEFEVQPGAELLLATKDCTN